MKKVLVMIISIMLMLCMVVSASAASADVSLNAANAQVKTGEQIVVMLSFSGIDAATSAYVEVTTPEGLELASSQCKWLVDGKIVDFTGNEGTIAFGAAVSLKGDALKLVFKGKTASAQKSTIQVNASVKNGVTSVLNKTASVKVQVVCASHSFGNWETQKAATCTAEGKQSRTCGVCGVVETKSVAALGHKMGQWSRVKEPTCTQEGQDARICSVCSANENRSVKALGHKYGSYKVTEEATCTTKGVKTSTCSVCGDAVTAKIALKAHKYDDGVVTLEPTQDSTGVLSKTCLECGHVVEEEIPALDIPEETTIPETTTEPATEPQENEPTVTPTNPSNIDMDSEEQDTTWAIVAIVVVCVAVILVVLLRKKKSFIP